MVMTFINKVTDSIPETKLGILSEWSLRLCLSWIFFYYGQQKFNHLIATPEEPFSYILKMDFFSSIPIVSSWLITLSEFIFIPLLIVLGGLKFIGPVAKAMSTIGGILATIVMIIIIWGYHLPVEGESFSDIHLQLMILAMSVYFTFK